VAAAPRYLLDTNILSDMMRTPEGRAAQRFRSLLVGDESVHLCTSVIVQCELLFGLRRRTQPRWHTQYQRLIESLDVMPLQADAVLHYAQLRAHLELAGTPLSPNDLLIAAHALAMDAALVSADVAFTRVPGLKLENWLVETT
jgi:tRNA(fMet)-specific endonuclease VapC